MTENSPNLTIIGFGQGWIAVDKPSGISTHNHEVTGSDMVSLVREFLAVDHKLRARTNPDPKFAPAPVHRLDSGTSGIMLVALTHKRAQALAGEFASGKVIKSYLAVVKGIISEPQEWKFPLAEGAAGRRNPAGSGPRKASHTSVRPLRHNQYFTLIEATLQTGRTHQIRRHAALAKHVIIGDERYGNPEYVRKIREIYSFDRTALHSSRIEIKIDGMVLSLTAALPEAFESLFA